MKLTKKVRIIFLPAMLVPLLLIAVAGAVIGGSVTKFLPDGDREIATLLNPLVFVQSMTENAYEELQSTLKRSPEKIEQEKYIKKISKNLSKVSSTLIIRKENTLVYGENVEKYPNLKEELPSYFEQNNGVDEESFLVDSKHNIMLRQIDFKYKDGARGSVFIISDLQGIFKHISLLVTEILLAAVLIILMTNSILSGIMYYEFIRPIGILKEGMDRIKNGDLETNVEVINSHNELGELSISFNEMREKLQESIDARLRYEEENRILISSISHDLKTPITAIKGYVEGLLDGVAATPEKREKYIKTIYNKAIEMDSMINELSLYTKIDCNSIPYHFEKINLQAYFDDCMEDIGSDMEQHGMDFTFFNYCTQDTWIVADVEQLKRVISNIVTNAIKYNDKEKGHINIRLRDREKFVQVEIEDNGMGVDKKDLPYIFERLYRADASRNSKRGGSGLGLSIAKKIIEEHGGKIWARSKLNIGTSIFFTLVKYEEELNYEQNTDH